MSGSCGFSGKGAIIAGVLITLVVLLVCILCCCCCGADQNDPKNRAVDEGRGPMARMKHHVRGVLANLSSTSFSFGNQKLPKITVSHHDDVTFNCSFIDSPSAGWDSVSFSSFEPDEESPVYCVPPHEGNTAVGEGFQEMSSRCNYLPAENSEFNSVEGLETFSIPRTSSIVKAKRPSVSFAEGTKFAPEERRDSLPENKVEPSNNGQRKRKLSWTLSKLPPIQSASAPSDLHLPICEPYEFTELVQESRRESETESGSAPPVAGAGDRARTWSDAKGGPRDAAERAENATAPGDTEPGVNEQRVTTVYVMVGKPQRPSKAGGVQAEGGGKVQAMLKRFGSFQRQRSSPREGRRPIARGEGVSKARQKFIALDKSNRH